MKIGGKQHYLWRAVDQDGEIVDMFLQTRRDAKAAKRFFQRFLKSGDVPREIVTDIPWTEDILSCSGFDLSRLGVRSPHPERDIGLPMIR